MPLYEYVCPENGRTVEIRHSMSESLHTWGELCRAAGLDRGDTAAEAPVERIIFAAAISTPAGNAKLKEMGFTKLVRRDKGVYENVTATNSEKRYVVAGDSSSMPDFRSKVGD